MKKVLLFGLSLLMATTMSFAQDRTVSGTVTSTEDGSTLPGVNVVVKGTTQGGVTDMDGNYKITVPEEGGTLVFSFIGLETQEVEMGTRSIIDLQMATDVKQLSEVVVVGYGTVDKRKLISSISSVKGSDIAYMPVASFDAALQGKAAGVQVSTTSGLLGQAPKIRIRGINSISSGTSPLIVVDGVPIETGSNSAVAPNNGLGDINPADIASFEILKDGAATAIYGSRASNGVILITTKSGVAGKPTINYDFYVGFNEVAKKFDLLNAEEFVQISNEKFATAGISPQAFAGDNNVDTDWQDEIYRQGFVQSHNLSFSGGNENVKYFVSAGYMDQEGAIVNNSIKRYSLRANVDYTGSDWIEAGVKVQVSRQVNEGLNTGTNALSGNVFNATKAFPNVAPLSDTHPTGYNLTDDNQSLGRGNNLQNIAFNLPNIKYVMDKNMRESISQRLMTNGYIQVNLPFDIKLRSQLGIDVTDARDFLSRNPLHGDGSPTGFVYRLSNNITRWNWQNTLSYRTTIADMHSINVVVGNEYQKNRQDQFTGQGQGFSDVFFLQQGLISGAYDTQFSSGFVGEEGFESIFGRLNYDFDNRYLLSVSLRNDAISSLPLDTRRGTFYGVSAGWNVAQESFFNVELIDELKFRAGYAITGNTAITTAVLFPYLGTYGPELYGDLTAIRFENVGNSSLKWETTTKLNVGVDFSILKNRVSGSVDWFQNDVVDLILQAPTAPSLGIPRNIINKNIGALMNTGFEFNFNVDILRDGDFKWFANLNITASTNEVTALANNNEDVINTDYNILRVGEPVGAIFGFDYVGVNSTNGNPIYRIADGSMIQADPDNNSYYVYNESNPNEQVVTNGLTVEDKIVLGQTNPKVFGGFNNSFSFKGLDLLISTNYAFGQKVYNATRQDGMSMFFVNNIAEIRNRWTPANPNTDVPRLSYVNDNFLNQDGNATSRFLEKGDFVRIQNITLGYTLPKSVISKIGLNRIRAYVSVQNPFVFTGYKGLDPELSFSNTSNIQAGVDLNSNPILRTYTFGLNIGL